MGDRTIAFDTESRGLDWFDEDQRAFLASWADEGGEYVSNLAVPEERGRFVKALEEADTIVAHNLSFDTHMVRASLGVDVLELRADLHDTDLLSRVLFPEGQRGGRGGHGLKKLATVHLREDAGEAEKVIGELAKQIGTSLKKTGGYYDVWRAYPEQLEHYAAKDARYTYDLYRKFSEKLEGDAERCYALERDCAPVLIRAEERGVRVDSATVRRLHGAYVRRGNGLRKALTETLGDTALGGEGSEEGLVDALLGLGVPLHRKTDTGKLATHQFALAEFEKDFPVLAEFGEYRRVSKFLSTYIEPMLERDVVHPSYRQCGAWTGRMSCTRPNMQNLPKHGDKSLRGMFVPREGHAFVVMDYEGIEVRLLAYYLNDPGFRELIEEGLDPHAWMATQLHGGAIEDYTKGGPLEGLRAKAKNTLFAIVYGAGAPRVSDMNGIRRDEAKVLIKQIKDALPKYYKLKARIDRKIKEEGYVTTLFGRKQPVSRDKSYVGLNALIQGSAADIMKAGLVAVDQAVQDLGATPLLVVHDEIVVEVPIENAEECSRRTAEALCSAYPLTPPLAVEGGITTTSYADV